MHFIKGHMGGNQIVLLNGDEIEAGKELGTGLYALDERGIGGHQAWAERSSLSLAALIANQPWM